MGISTLHQRALRVASILFTLVLLFAVAAVPIGRPGTARAAGNNALQFDGTNDYVTFGAAPSLGVTSFTLETWFMRTGAGHGVGTGTGGITSAVPLVTKGGAENESPANINMNYFLGIDASSGQLVADFEEAAGPNHPVTGTAVVTSNVWHHAAVTYDATTGTWKLYLDGVLDKTLVLSSNFQPESASIQHAALGTSLTSTGAPAQSPSGVTGWFQGALDEARIWNVVRTPGEIAAARDQELTSGPPSLIARWGMNEGTGTAVGNSIAGGVNGTATNGPVWVSGFVPPPGTAPNAPTLNAPANGSSGIGTSPTLSVGVSDPEANPLTVTFFGRPLASGNFTQIAQNTAVASGSNTTTTWANLGSGQTYEWYVTVSDGTSTTTGPTWTFHTTQSADPVFVGAGDIAECSNPGDESTAAILAGVEGQVFTVGDNVYPDGALVNFNNCYDPSWGAPSGIKARTRPATGNHDWAPGNLDGYFAYYGAAAGGSSYYSYDVSSSWHVVVLDTECGMVAGGCFAASPQASWLASDLNANATKNVIAIWHKPLYSSGATNETLLQPLWNIMVQHGVDVLLQGHDHIYERQVPMGSTGAADPTSGIRVFTVGTGGQSHHNIGTVRATSEVRNNDTFGIFKLTLHASSYDWKFLPVAGGTFTDSGSAAILTAANQPPDQPTLNAPANASSGIGTSPTLDVGVSDPDSDPLTVTFFGRPLASGIFAQIAQNTAVASGSSTTTLWASLGSGQTYEWYVTVSDGTSTTTGPTWTFHTTPSVDPVFVGSGDIGSCAVTTDSASGDVIAGIDGHILTVGDNVYPNGTAADFANCYAPTPWGSAPVKSRTRPIPGNHDWGAGVTNNLDGYFGYFGSAATDGGGKSYYSYDIDSHWHVVNLDSQCELVPGGCDVGSPQETWLRADLAANPGKNVIAMWHKPRYSSGTTNYQALQPLWDDLYAAGADILLDGHDHIYERFAPMKSGATPSDPPVADPTYGIQQFTIGTGGEEHHLIVSPLATSQVRDNTTFGIFKLTLHATTYDWVFLPIDGSTFTDSGTGTVHSAPATLPGAPTSPSAVAGDAEATVNWTIPADDGGSAITGYTVTSTPGSFTGSASGPTATSAIVSGLANGTSYTFTVHATNGVGNGPESAATNAVTPNSGGATYVPLTPARLLDTRVGNGLSGAFSPSVPRTFQVTGRGGVPSTAVAVTGNLTVTAQTNVGYLFLGPNPDASPTSSTLNFPVGDNRANGVTVALGAGGTLSATYVADAGSTDVIFDVTGYFR